MIPKNNRNKGSSGSSANKNAPVGTKTNDKQSIVRKNAPVSYGNTTTALKPRFTTKAGNTIVTHREFVREVRGLSTDVSMISELITPDNPGLFPWLSTISRNYEMFRFHKLKFEYVSRSPTTIYGSITYAVDFDPTDIPDPDLIQICQMEGARSTNVWLGCTLEVKGKDLHPQERMYVSNEPGVPSRKTDLGRLIEFIDKMSSSNTVGQLWVSYSIEMIKPQPAAPLSGMKVTASTSTSSSWIIPDDQYYSAGGVAIYSTPGFQDTIVFKQSFQGLLQVMVRAIDNSGIPLWRMPNATVSGQFLAFRCMNGLSDERQNGHIAGDHGIYQFLVKTGPVGKENRITFDLATSFESAGIRSVAHVRSILIPGDVQVLNRIVTSNSLQPPHDYVPWTVPNLPGNLPLIPLPVSHDYPQ